jgi:hypothetical protein
MKKEWIQLMIENETLKLKFTDLLIHYSIVLFLLFPFVLTLFSFVQKYILHNYKGVRSPEEMFLATLPFGIIAIAFYFIQRNKLKFKTVETNLSKEKIKEIIEKTAKELEWYPLIINERIIIAKTHPKWWTGSWGEQITIVFDKSRLMINSICDPDKKTSVVSMGRNRKNVNTLIENIKIANLK